MAEYHGAQHHIFRQLVGFRLHHQHGTFGTRHHQVQLGGFQFRRGWVEHVLAVDIADAGGAHRAVERQAG